jgi:hypothetical protein
MKYLAILFSMAAVGILIPATTPYTGPVFTDVTAQAGIRFVHNSGRAGAAPCLLCTATIVTALSPTLRPAADSTSKCTVWE